jgi:DNA-binding CsgD family transcriptional regulator
MLRCDYHRFTSQDVASMLDLSRELHEMPPGFLLRVERMLKRLCGIIGAQVAIFSDLKHYLPDHNWEIKPLLDFGWAGAAERATFMSFFEGEQLDDPLTAPCARIRSTATVSRQQLVTDQAWYRSPNVNELRRRGRLDDCIYSHLRLEERGRAIGIAFHRPWGDPPFAERERAIVDVFHRSQPLYNRHTSLDRRGSNLSTRQQQVLAALQDGDSEKQVAAKLEMSIHTVHSHVKNLYERFNVNSRGELLSLWVKNPSHTHCGPSKLH